jgi:hypothetical protein
VRYWVKILWFTVFCDDESQSKKRNAHDKKKKSDKPKKTEKRVDKSKPREEKQKREPDHLNGQKVEWQDGLNGQSKAQQDSLNGRSEVRKERLNEPGVKPMDKSKPSDWQGVKQKNTSDSEDRSVPPDTAEQPVKKRRPRLVSQIMDKIKVTWNRIKRKYQRLYQHFQTSSNKAKMLKKLWETETTQKSYRLVKTQLVRLLKHIKPRKVICDIHFGCNDPALTGEVLAGLAVVYGLSGIQLNVRPDFEQACLEGTLFIKGRVQLVLLAVIALRVFFDKYSKKTYERFHKIIGGN